MENRFSRSEGPLLSGSGTEGAERPRTSSLWRRRRCRIGGVSGRITHLDGAIEDGPLFQLETSRDELTLDSARRLYLEPRFCTEAPPQRSRDYRILRGDVALNDAVLSHHDGLGRPDVALDRTLNS